MTTALVATATAQAKGHVFYTQFLVGTATAQSQARAALSNARAQLVASATAQAKAHVGTSASAALKATATAQAKANGLFRDIAPPIYFNLATLMRDTAIGAIGDMNDTEIDVLENFP